MALPIYLYFNCIALSHQQQRTCHHINNPETFDEQITPSYHTYQESQNHSHRRSVSNFKRTPQQELTQHVETNAMERTRRRRSKETLQEASTTTKNSSTGGRRIPMHLRPVLGRDAQCCSARPHGTYRRPVRSTVR